MSASVYSQNSATNSGIVYSLSTTITSNAGDSVLLRVWSQYGTDRATNVTATVNGVAATYLGVTPGGQVAVTFTTAPSGASGSTTITSAWAGGSGTYSVLLSTGQLLPMTFTQSSTTVTWSTAVTGSPTTSASVYFSSAVGNINYLLAENVAAGTLAVSVSGNSQAPIAAVSVIDITGVTASSFQGFVQTSEGGNGSGTITSNPITTFGSVFLSAFINDFTGNMAYSPAVGTNLAWTGESAVWPGITATGNVACGLGEYVSLSSSGTTAAQFTLHSGISYDNCSIGIVALNVQTVLPNRGYETIGTGVTPDDSTGDTAVVGGIKLNDALNSLYSVLGLRATTVGAFNTASAAGTTTTLVDSTTTWATNQFAGQYVTITTGALPLQNGTIQSNVGYASLIASNTATTLTFAPLPFATTLGCGYDISPVITTNSTDGQATTVGGTAPSTLIDATKNWTTNQWAGYFARLFTGPYSGQVVPIASNTATTLTLSTALATALAAGTTYVIGTGPIAASQYVTSGTTVTVNPGTLWLELNGPTTMTVTFPASPYDTQPLEISTTTAITTFATAGGTVSGAPATMSANTGIRFRYHVGTTTWYRTQ